ncbi:MAG: hypothetical protein ACRC4X_03830 [Cetobacterium sp.]
MAEPAGQDAKAEQEAKAKPAGQEAKAEQRAKAGPAGQEAKAEQRAKAEPAGQEAKAEQGGLKHRAQTNTHTQRERVWSPNCRLRWAGSTGCREPQWPDWDRTKQEPSRMESAKEIDLKHKTKTDTHRERKRVRSPSSGLR